MTFEERKKACLDKDSKHEDSDYETTFVNNLLHFKCLKHNIIIIAVSESQETRKVFVCDANNGNRNSL